MFANTSDLSFSILQKQNQNDINKSGDVNKNLFALLQNGSVNMGSNNSVNKSETSNNMNSMNSMMLNSLTKHQNGKNMNISNNMFKNNNISNFGGLCNVLTNSIRDLNNIKYQLFGINGNGSRTDISQRCIHDTNGTSNNNNKTSNFDNFVNNYSSSNSNTSAMQQIGR